MSDKVPGDVGKYLKLASGDQIRKLQVIPTTAKSKNISSLYADRQTDRRNPHYIDPAAILALGRYYSNTSPPTPTG